MTSCDIVSPVLCEAPTTLELADEAFGGVKVEVGERQLSWLDCHGSRRTDSDAENVICFGFPKVLGLGFHLTLKQKCDD